MKEIRSIDELRESMNETPRSIKEILADCKKSGHYVIFGRGSGKSTVELEKLRKKLKEVFESESEETRLRAQRLAAAIYRGEVEAKPDIWDEEMIDEHKYSGLIADE